MCAIEKSVSIHNIVPEAFANICGIVICFTLDVVFMTAHILDLTLLGLVSISTLNSCRLLVAP